MATINFVPDDYILQRQSSRANLLYLALLAALLGGIGVTFSILKMRQAAIRKDLSQLNQKMVQAKEQIAQLEQLKTKGKTMMKSMVMTAELLEPAPRSIILASLTNNLPSGTSLLNLKMIEKEIKINTPVVKAETPAAKPAAKSQPASAKNKKAPAPEIKSEWKTGLEIEGIAPSDIEVAEYIANLGNSVLLDEVELVESKEQDVEGVKFRQFRLRTLLRSNLTLTRDDIVKIRQKRDENS